MLAAAIALFLAPASIGDRVTPIDQCRGDKSFLAFRDGLKRAIARRDVTAVMAALDDEILVDLGGGQGKASFRSAWQLDRPRRSPLWVELQRTLDLGCTLSDGVRLSPSMVAQLDPELDMVDIVVATAPGAVLRDRPSARGRAIANVGWRVLAVASWPDTKGYVHVRLGKGRTGYVRRSEVRSPLDRRVTMERVDGAWKITTFVAGD